MSNETQLDPTKPRSFLIYQEGDEFGLVCDRSGALASAKSEAEHLRQRQEMMEEYQGRGGTWVASTAMFAMQFKFKAITCESFDHLRELVGEGPFTIKSIGGVAGSCFIMCIPREKFTDLIDKGTDIGF